MKAVKHVSFNCIKEITLLTIEQAKRLPRELLACGEWWWLRSPGYYQYTAAFVSTDGSVSYGGDCVYSDRGCVRPAFVIPGLDSKIYDQVHVGGCVCTVVDKDLVLADDVVCYHRFDAKSNDWNKSELRAFIESDEFLKKLEGGKLNELDNNSTDQRHLNQRR